ncbi:MAG: hypothetical protein ED557_03340 [Balneola sp.]|nr:MAG: hypothetical protein ED557_03340 [Balneola sp.]
MSNELQLAWDELQTELQTDTIINKEEIMAAIKSESKNPLQKLRYATKIRLYWTIFFAVFCFLGAVLSFNYPRAIFLWGIGFAYYFGGVILVRHHLNKLDDNFDHNIKSLLENYYNRLTKMLSIEELVGTFILPVSVVLGYCLSGVYDGETFTQIFSDAKGIALLMGVMVVFTAIALWGTKRLNYKAYGKYLEQLKTNIDLLNTINK